MVIHDIGMDHTALSGFTLLLEGLHQEIPKGYIYFAVAFSLLIEFTNIRVKKKRKKKPVKLNKGYDDDELNKAVESLEK